jgi:hypothetical protein
MRISPDSPRYVDHQDASTISLDANAGSFHRVWINGARTLSLVNFPVDGYIWLRVFQTGTAALPTWPPGITWIGGAPAAFVNGIIELYGSGQGTIDARATVS